ncbi:extracellular solute-binding protein, partial [Rhizobium ruizarguesonis]
QRTDKLPQGKEMKSWADFWDVTTFPCPRAMRKTSNHTLEFALIADGVSKNDVYNVLATSEGVDREFAKMDQIKPRLPRQFSLGFPSLSVSA